MPKISAEQLLATFDTDELLTELLRRDALKKCEASVLIDGRAIAKMEDADQLSLFMELRLLETLAKGFATAAAHDRVHTFEGEPAHGDLPPGSEVYTVGMLAVATNA